MTRSSLSIKKEQITSCLLPALLILLGSVLRLYALGDVPGGMHQDESFVALNAFDMFHEARDSSGRLLPVYMSSWGDGQSAMYIWLLTPLLALNNGHVTALLCRIPQAVIGILTLLAVYLLMKKMFNRSVGLVSLFLLAICPWHIMMSRWGLDANMAPGFLMFALLFFIKGLEKEKFLMLSALFYGLSLYCYAVIWPIVPFILVLQIVYGLYHKKLRINRWSLLSAGILLVLALPLILFVLVNSTSLPEIALPFMTIPKTSGYRGGELASGLTDLLNNLKKTLALLAYQNTGSPYDILLPWGLFYDIGRIFIILGAVLLLIKVVRSFLRKEFAYEYFIFASLAGGGMTSLLVSANLHQINNLFIPLVLCEAYGVYSVLHFLYIHHKKIGQIASGVLAAVYLVCLVLFRRDYYTSYKEVVNAYFAEGLEECVDYALEQCEELGLSTITAEKGAQWPRLLLYTETLSSQYLSSVEYDVAPAPAAFTTSDQIRVNTRINYDDINQQSIYIIYFTDVPTFEADFNLTQFHDWYVAVPKY